MNDGLPTFREGMALAPQLTARALNAIVAAIRRNRVTPGPNQLLDQSTGGTQVWNRRGRSIISQGPILPFSVSLVTPASDTAPTAGLQVSSRIYKSISTTNTLSITDLGTAITLASNTYVWIQVTVSALAPTAAAIITGTAWPSLVVTSGSPAAQTQFNVPIGRVMATAPTKPGFEFSITISGVTTYYHFEQCLFSHLLIEDRCNNGTPIIYAFPWGGAA